MPLLRVFPSRHPPPPPTSIALPCRRTYELFFVFRIHWFFLRFVSYTSICCFSLSFSRFSATVALRLNNSFSKVIYVIISVSRWLRRGMRSAMGSGKGRNSISCARKPPSLDGNWDISSGKKKLTWGFVFHFYRVIKERAGFISQLISTEKKKEGKLFFFLRCKMPMRHFQLSRKYLYIFFFYVRLTRIKKYPQVRLS